MRFSQVLTAAALACMLAAAPPAAAQQQGGRQGEQAEAGLSVPEAVAAGSIFSIVVAITSRPGDRIEIGPPEGDPVEVVTVAATNTVEASAPQEPGTYEVRYRSSAEGEVLARVPLRVE